MKSLDFQERSMQTRIFSRKILATAILAASAGGYLYANGGITAVHAAPAAAVSSVSGMAVATDFSGIVESEGPAVVNISVTGKAKAPAAATDDDDDDDDDGGAPQMNPNDPLYQFFKRFGPQQQMPRHPQLMRAQGSGFIVSPDGLILTNAHVVDGATEVTVKLTDRREFQAKVLGSDKQSDIAVIKIEAKNLPVVQLGDPALSKVGEPVLAIGSPYGFDNTATAGIISAKSRSLPDDTYVPFIQTDVACTQAMSSSPSPARRSAIPPICRRWWPMSPREARRPSPISATRTRKPHRSRWVNGRPPRPTRAATAIRRKGAWACRCARSRKPNAIRPASMAACW
jgi:serine protease Do